MPFSEPRAQRERFLFEMVEDASILVLPVAPWVVRAETMLLRCVCTYFRTSLPDLPPESFEELLRLFIEEKVWQSFPPSPQRYKHVSEFRNQFTVDEYMWQTWKIDLWKTQVL